MSSSFRNWHFAPRVTVPVLLLVSSLALNWAQHAQIMRYKRALVERGRLDSLTVGTPLPPLRGFALDGSPRTIEYGAEAKGRPTVIYYFSPECGWCKRNSSNVNELYRGLSGSHRFVGVAVSSKGVDHYLREHGHAFDIIVNIDRESMRAYRFSGTPQTIRVGADGRVSHVWSGAYSRTVQHEVEQVFGMKLPGLTEPISQGNREAGLSR